eukprot:TRINITY_DN14585_c0_g1_i13.p1 TRINITY_DN14585_c0_g1~~TRINITY_DN14585_c0_g1_i13.p1  ORF type:complete len:211 (+),score=6.25 TRINITY_DN14585_c0_g1_i13:71-703(+)
MCIRDSVNVAGSGRSLLNRAAVDQTVGQEGFELWNPLDERSFADRMLSLNQTRFLILDQGSDMFQAMFLPFDGCVLHIANPNADAKVKFDKAFTKGLGGCFVLVEGVVQQEYGHNEGLYVQASNSLVTQINGVVNRSPHLPGTYRWSHIKELNGRNFTLEVLKSQPLKPTGPGIPYIQSYTLSFSYNLTTLRDQIRYLTSLPYSELKMLG